MESFNGWFESGNLRSRYFASAPQGLGVMGQNLILQIDLTPLAFWSEVKGALPVSTKSR